MVRLIRCIIDECGVSRTSMVYDDPATDCISQSFENANAEISKYTFEIILEFALNRKRARSWYFEPWSCPFSCFKALVVVLQ